MSSCQRLEVGADGQDAELRSRPGSSTPSTTCWSATRRPGRASRTVRRWAGSAPRPRRRGLIAFLLSDESSHITGQNVVIDGGTMLTNAQMDPVLGPAARELFPTGGDPGVGTDPATTRTRSSSGLAWRGEWSSGPGTPTRLRRRPRRAAQLDDTAAQADNAAAYDCPTSRSTTTSSSRRTLWDRPAPLAKYRDGPACSAPDSPEVRVGGVFQLRTRRGRHGGDWWPTTVLVSDPTWRRRSASNDRVKVPPITYDLMRCARAAGTRRPASGHGRQLTEASMCFRPASVRACGQRFYEAADKELAGPCVKAYNDWRVGVVRSSGGRPIPRIIVAAVGPGAAAEIRRFCPAACPVRPSEIPPYLNCRRSTTPDGLPGTRVGAQRDRHGHEHTHRLQLQDAVHLGGRADAVGSTLTFNNAMASG